MPVPLIISIDGNIGAGKSTLCAKLAEKLPQLKVIQEPVGTWEKFVDDEGVNLLSHFYKDTTRWAYTFQNCAILTRLMNTYDAMKEFEETVMTNSAVPTWQYQCIQIYP